MVLAVTGFKNLPLLTLVCGGPPLQPSEMGAGRKVSGREAVSVHTVSPTGVSAAAAVELADGGACYR